MNHPPAKAGTSLRRLSHPHLDADKFAAAVAWFIRALADDGILVLTTHGRGADYCERVVNRNIDPALWQAVLEAHAETRFGYTETERNEAGSYGFSLSAPSWVMRLVERDPAVHIIGFREGAWDHNQDVLALQRRSIDWQRPPWENRRGPKGLAYRLPRVVSRCLGIATPACRSSCAD